MISGLTRRPNGAPAGRAIVRLLDGSDTLIVQVLSESDGSYALHVPYGDYTLTATKPPLHPSDPEPAALSVENSTADVDLFLSGR